MKREGLKSTLLILMGLFSFLTLFLYLIEILSEDRIFSLLTFIKSVFISFPFMALIAYIDYKLVCYINKSLWLGRHLIIRIITEFILLALLAVFFVILGNIPFRGDHTILAYLLSISYGKSVIASVLLNVFTVTVIEFFVQSERNRALVQENAQIKYLQLKNQINPHFLFNSLNVLVALIHKDSERAAHYTQKLSGVYRYVLSSDNEACVALRQEVKFIENYIDILQIRFGKGLMVQFDIAEADYTRGIPPMSLQLLVENAVKHNALDLTNSLLIKIASQSDGLVVSNNVISRYRVEESMGIGLKNLQATYKMLTNKPVIIEQNTTQFTVKLPLL